MRNVSDASRGQRETALSNAVWIGIVTVTGLASAWCGLVIWAVTHRLWTHTPLDWSLLAQAPYDPDAVPLLALIPAALVLELMVNGWRRHPLRRLLLDSRSSDRIDAFYIIANFTGLDRVLTIVLSFGLAALVDLEADTRNWQIASDLPLWAAVPALCLLAEFLDYWGHRLVMHSPLLWPFHAVHHAAEDMTVLTAFRQHPLEAFVQSLWFFLPAGLLGFSPEAFLITGMIISCHSMLQHSNLPFPAWLERYVAGPRAHRIHHCTDEACHHTNFAVFTILDRMFGTYHMQDVTTLSTGLADPRYQSGRPMHEMISVIGIWLSDMRDMVLGTRLTPILVAGVLLTAGVALRGFAAEPTIANKTRSEHVTVKSVAAERSQFRVTLADGRVLHSPELTGAELIIATDTGEATIRIAAVERDPDATHGEIWLHTMLLVQHDGSTANLCDPGPDGRQQGFPIAGHLFPDGHIEATAPEQFELVCTSGARGKCVRFGYRPWEPAEHALYNACTRMVPADYRGDGTATTRNGMSIDLYDDRHIQNPANDPGQDFEAGWNADGAVCVRHVRVKENISLEALVRAAPRFTDVVGAACTEARARSLGAILFNRSKP